MFFWVDGRWVSCDWVENLTLWVQLYGNTVNILEFHRLSIDKIVLEFHHCFLEQTYSYRGNLRGGLDWGQVFVHFSDGWILRFQILVNLDGFFNLVTHERYLTTPPVKIEALLHQSFVVTSICPKDRIFPVKCRFTDFLIFYFENLSRPRLNLVSWNVVLI